MLLPAPNIDKRSADEIMAESRVLAPFYASEWNARESAGAGFALLQNFSQMLLDVIQHLNLAPEKNFAEFLARLGIKLQPPRPARVALTFLLAQGTPENVLIPARTQAAAAATEARPEMVFETEQNLLATIAALQAVFSVRPADDRIFEHFAALKSSQPSTLLDGANLQEHVFYLGHRDFLNLKGVAKISLKITPTNAATIQNLKNANLVVWEYSLGKDEDTRQERWHAFTGVSNDGNTLILIKGLVNQIDAISLNQIDNRWIRCRAKGALTASSLLKSVEVDTVQLAVATTEVSGWIELPGGGRTASRPAAVVSAGRLFVFVQSVDNKILMNRLAADGSWSGWSEVPGNGRTPSDPAAVVLNDKIYLFVRGLNNGIWWNHQDETGKWTGWSELPGNGRTPSGPAAVVVNEQIYLFVRGLNNGIFMNRRDGAGNWNGWSELPGLGRTPSGPAAVLLNDKIYLFVRGLNNGIWWNHQDATGNWTIIWSELPALGQTLSGPAAVVVNDQLNILVRRTDNKILINRLGTDGSLKGSDEVPGDGQTPFGPAAAVFNNQLFLLARGSNNGILINAFAPSRIDLLFFNDVPLDPNSPFHPFGKQPRPFDAFYIASKGAFSKKNSVITLDFNIQDSSTATPSDPPVVGWEYWNGTGWVNLPLAKDELKNFLTKSTALQLKEVEFVCPNDLMETSVNGQENFWIRARIAGGSYGVFALIEDAAGKRVEPKFRYPTVNRLTISYDTPAQALEQAITYNNLRYDDQTENAQSGGAIFQPFQPPEEDKPAVYLGFDKPLVSGPIGIFFALEKKDYLEENKPRLQWQYYNGTAWIPLDVLDDTDNLTRSGILQLVGPADFAAQEKFGGKLFWTRAVDVENRFAYLSAPPPAAVLSLSASLQVSKFLKLFRLPGTSIFGGTRISQLPGLPEAFPGSAAHAETACTDLLELIHPKFSVPQVLGNFPPPPTLQSIFPNTAWAIQAQTIRDEILGSSDGRANQQFTLARTPVVSEEIWVNEIKTLLEEERKKLLEQGPGQLQEVRDDKGNLIQAWVRWHSVEDFLDSTPASRHYVMDRVLGIVQFGDGNSGMAPPIGTDNVKANYQFGGGIQGNVEAGKVITLKTAVAGVDKVMNPEPAGGGADPEPLAKALERGPQVIKHRHRAMAREDFEWLVRQAFDSIAKVRCLPTTNQNGEFETGWVAVIIVPKSQEAQPLPTAELIRQVKRYLDDRCPNVVASAGKLIVTGPAYVELSVKAKVFATAIDLISPVQSDAVKSLKKFLHPLAGGPEGEGWDFGRLICHSDIVAMLEALPNVDHVDEVSMQLRQRLDGTNDLIRNVTGDELLSATLPPYAMIFSGEHDITVTFQASV